jgi:hypothetical protein
MALVGVGCTALVAVVFGFAAFGKLRDRAAWAEFVTTTGAMLPTRRVPARPVAVVVAGTECVTALLAVVALVTRAAVAEVAALSLAAVLLAVFLFGITGVVRSGRRVRCRCFGAGGAAFGRSHLVRNGVLLLTVACGLVAGRYEPLDGAALVAAVTGAVLGLAAVHWDEVAYLFSDPATVSDVRSASSTTVSDVRSASSAKAAHRREIP